MDQLRDFLVAIKDAGVANGHLRGLLHILIGRHITKADGNVVSTGLTWRATADLLRRVRWDPDQVRDLGFDPNTLPVRDRDRFWYAAIARAGVDTPDAKAAGDHLARAAKKLGYVIT